MKLNEKDIDSLYKLLLVIITITILLRGITYEIWQPDAWAHAMDGVYFYDLIKDLPVFNLYEYTLQYYAKYPALGIVYYPPFFAFVEGIFYLCFGISPTTAKLTVLCFALLCVLVWYQLVKCIFDKHIAVLSGMLLITTPKIVYFSREVMLEMPTLALIIMCIYFCYNWVELQKRRYVYYLAITLILSILTKQTAFFVIPVLISYILYRGRYRLLFSKDAFICYFLLLVCLLPFVILSFKAGGLITAQSIGDDTGIFNSKRWNITSFIFYFKHLPEHLSIPVLVLSTVSIIISVVIKDTRRSSALFLFWLVWWYIVFWYLLGKSSRYAFFWLPPFCLFTTLLLYRIPWKIMNKVSIGVVCLICLCVYQYVYSYPLRSYLAGYAEAAKYVVDKGAGVVLFDGYCDGHFVFHVRRFDKDKNMIVLRGSKMLYSCALDPRMIPDSLKEYVQDDKDVYSMLDKYGISYVIIEDKNILGVKASDILRDVLAKNMDDFTLCKKIKLITNRKHLIGVSLLVYKYNKCSTSKVDTLRLKIPIINKVITVPFKALIKNNEIEEKK